MAKFKRLTVGSVVKSQDPLKTDYIKLRGDMKKELLEAVGNMDNKGLYLTLESPKEALRNLEKAVEAGKISPENASKARERIESTPDWVRFNIILVQKN